MNQLPPGWVRTAVGEVFEVSGGGTPPTAVDAYWQGSIPWISSADISVHGKISPRAFITAEAIENSATTLVPAGSVIVVTRVGLGKVAVAPVDLCYSQDNQALLVPAGEICAEYVAHYLRFFADQMTRNARGTTISGVTKRVLLDLPFLLPPYAEQCRIVSAIEEHVSRLDAAVAELERVRAQLPRYRGSVLKAAMEGRWESQAPESPEIEACRELSLGAIASVQLGKMLSEKARTGRGARPYLRNINVRWTRFDLDDLLEMDFSEREAEKYALLPGDVLVCEGGEPGRAAVWRGARQGLMYQKALHRVRLDPNRMLPEFLVYQLWHLAGSGGLARRFTGSTIKHLPLEDMLELTLRVPALAQQGAIVEWIERQLSFVDALAQTVDTALARAERLRQAILKQAFEGKLVPQNPHDEPADKLLEGIRAQPPGTGGGPPRGLASSRKRASKGSHA